MATQNFFSLCTLKTRFDFVEKGFLEEFVYGTMLRLANSFWVFACKCWFYLFGFIAETIFRLNTDYSSQKNDWDCRVDHSQRDDQIASGFSTVVDSDESGERENHDFFFGFPFQNCETESSDFHESSPTPNTSKYQVMNTKDFRGFMEEPIKTSFTVQELFVGSNDARVSTDKCSPDLHSEEVQELPGASNAFSEGDDQTINRGDNQTINRVSVGEDFVEFNSEPDAVLPEKTEGSVEDSVSAGCDLHGEKETTGVEDNHSDPTNSYDEVELIDGNQFWPWDSEPETSNPTDEVSISFHKVDSVTDEFSSDGLEEPIDEKMQESIEKIPNREEISVVDSSVFEEAVAISREKLEDIDDEYIVLELNSQFPSLLDESFKRKEIENKHETEQSSQDSEDDDDGFDILLKHQDLIEQMKMEMKNARTKGLPTILEESETPKMAEDLKPLQIDEKLDYKDLVEEIQKVYKSYMEKMRKLDILNYQTLHAISFLQLKDPAQQAPGPKSSVPAMKSLIFPSLWRSKLRRIYADPTLKSITELHRNLEMVYVGQACLSWEILHWQHGKAKELLDHDPGGHRRYDQIAGEFQQFQVLVQRFVESEPFQGPRIQNYAKNRCELRALLQVPAIKEDCLKDRNDSGFEGDNPIQIAMLTETMDESIRVFWDFLRSDRDDANAIMKRLQATHSHLQHPSDSELLLDIKTSLQKKEKRVKEIMRSGKCIVKKFKKQQEGRVDRDLLFAQVELKLVTRVLNMSRLTTDQLVWCQNKLNMINFFNRNIHLDSSFLLFPF